MRREAPGLGPFLNQLEARLEQMTAEQLRGALAAHATHLPAAERAAFLAIFDPPPAPRATTAQADPGDPALLGDIDALLADIDDGVYAKGFGYDPDYGDHRTFGDETWTVEMRDLLERAGLAFLAGDIGQAREAYRRLLEALRPEHDEGGFPGAGTPEDVLGGVGEAKHRYLRAMWEAEPVAARATAVVEAAEDLDDVGDEFSLAALEATRREPLPDLDAVLPDLIAELQTVDYGRYGFGAQARQVLAEATERHRGVDGLADLAHIPGPNQAEAYRDWVDGLVRAGRLADAEQAAREALERLEAHGRVQATLAQRLAALAAGRGDGPALLEARQAAWRAEPALTRLLNLIDVATALDCRDEVVAAEADRSAASPLAERPPLAASVLLLAGRVGEAIGLLDGPDVLSWGHGYSPAPVIVPFLLVGACDAISDPQWNDLLLFELLDGANAAGWPRPGYGTGESLDDVPEPLRSAGDTPERFRAFSRDDLLLSALLADTLDQHPFDPDERTQWLDAARRYVEARVHDVVSGQHRGAYQQVAHLAAACAEAVALASGGRMAREFIDSLHARYPRHSAFRRELRPAVAASPLLHVALSGRGR